MNEKPLEQAKTDTSAENFAVLRKKLEKLEQVAQEEKRAREDETQRRLELENRLKSLSGVTDPVDEDEYNFISKKEFKSALEQEKEALRRSLKEDLEKESYQRKNDQFLNAHPDFHAVVTEENIKKLEQYDPYFASILSSVPDKVAQLKAAYGKVKEMQEKTAPKKASAHPYTTVSPFGMGGVPTLTGHESMNDPDARMAARKRLNEMKKGFNSGA